MCMTRSIASLPPSLLSKVIESGHAFLLKDILTEREKKKEKQTNTESLELEVSPSPAHRLVCLLACWLQEERDRRRRTAGNNDVSISINSAAAEVRTGIEQLLKRQVLSLALFKQGESINGYIHVCIDREGEAPTLGRITTLML